MMQFDKEMRTRNARVGHAGRRMRRPYPRRMCPHYFLKLHQAGKPANDNTPSPTPVSYGRTPYHHSLGRALRPWPTASLLRPAGSGSPFSPAIRLFAAISAILPRVAALALAMCGTTIQLGSDTSG